ncbi:unnamed protein product [Brassica rapa subsp. narinosa]|uniref:(rape) hypothetical protein n=1 Tax=Brassica napus TaxID=3708 RepID=A0A816Y566_BRANA|nr:unnamed protein product [Brassica napus]
MEDEMVGRSQSYHTWKPSNVGLGESLEIIFAYKKVIKTITWKFC